MLSLESELSNCKSLKMKNNSSNNFSYCSHGGTQTPQMFRGLALKMEVTKMLVCCCCFRVVQWQIKTHYTKSTESYYINGRWGSSLYEIIHLCLQIHFSHPRFCLHHVKNHTNSLWSQDPYFLFPVSFLQISHGPKAINVNHTFFH